MALKTLLLTGGTGFIGSFLVPRLLDNWQLVILSRQPAAQVQARFGAGVTVINALDQWPYGHAPAACINLAGAGILDQRWTIARKQELRVSRIDFTRNLVSWLNAFEKPAEVLLSGSAVGFYGFESGLAETDESAPAGQDFAARLCADWEQQAQAVHPETRLCLLRTGVVLEGHHGALKKMLPPFRLGLGGRVGSGRQMMPWIHIDDMVSGILFLLDNNQASGPFNMATQAVSNQAFTRALAQALQRPALFPVPALVLKCLLGEGASLLLEGQNPIPARLEKLGFRFRHPELLASLQDLLQD